MSVWGKIVGGAAGFAIGGPIGALLGAVAGHAVDLKLDDIYHGSEEDGSNTPDPSRSVAFTIAVIVLAAKMAKADGVVSRTEVETFKRVFRIPPEELRAVGRIFDKARNDAVGFEPYARQVARMFKGRRAVLEELIEGLFRIAEADGRLHQAELRYLHQVATLFGLSEVEFDRIKAGHVQATGVPESDPYAILGVPADADAQTIKAAHRRLVREHHPDLLIAQGMPQEFIDVATEKVAVINAAYDRIRAQRRLT